MSAMASKATVVWLRDELRVHDNALLAEAARRGAPVLPVFCLDPRVFDASAKSDLGSSQKTGARRAKFVLESLEDLRGSLKDLGSGLVVRRGSPRQVLADICEELGDITIISSEAACSGRTERRSRRVGNRAAHQGLGRHALPPRRFSVYPLQGPVHGLAHVRREGGHAGPSGLFRAAAGPAGAASFPGSTTPFPPWMTWATATRPSIRGATSSTRGAGRRGRRALGRRLRHAQRCRPASYVWDEDRHMAVFDRRIDGVPVGVEVSSRQTSRRWRH